MPETIFVGSYVRPVGRTWRGIVTAIYTGAPRSRPGRRSHPIAIISIEDGGGVFAESVDRLELAPAPTVTGEPR